VDGTDRRGAGDEQAVHVGQFAAAADERRRLGGQLPGRRPQRTGGDRQAGVALQDGRVQGA
jgi:hypothetical protein